MSKEVFGGGKPNGFTYWLEFKTTKLGGIGGGTAHKLGVYLMKSGEYWFHPTVFKNADDATAQLTASIVRQLDLAAKDDFDALEALDERTDPLCRYKALRGKILFIYFPDKFFPCFSIEQLKHLLTTLGHHPTPDAGFISLNRQLLNIVRAEPAFSGADSLQIMWFLYVKCSHPLVVSAQSGFRIYNARFDSGERV